MNPTEDQRVFSPITSELAVDERERRLQRRRERERARRDSETAEQREERLRKRRMRDRAIGAQLRLSNKESHVCNKDVIDWPSSQPKRERPGYNE